MIKAILYAYYYYKWSQAINKNDYVAKRYYRNKRKALYK